MAIDINYFLSQLKELGIIPEEKLKIVVSKKASFTDGEALARDMIKSNLVTKYQAEQILGGRGKNLFMGKYLLQEKLGVGGMGQVYKAFHSGTSRVVAIKVILTKGNKNLDTIKRFEREVKAASMLVHPNIITVFDADQANKMNFMVMELIEGADLSAIVGSKGPLGIGTAVNYILQAAKGLQYAHEKGIVHRDIKPANLLLNNAGNIKIVDMGLAKINAVEDVDKQSMLTATSTIMGTVDFMSPEQGFSSKNVDARADIYSLGATLFYLLTGKAMYAGDSIFEKMLAHKVSPIPLLGDVIEDMPEELENIFKKMVSKESIDRYQTMGEVIEDLNNLLGAGLNSNSNSNVETINFWATNLKKTHLKTKVGGVHNNNTGEIKKSGFGLQTTRLQVGISTVIPPLIESFKKLTKVVAASVVGVVLSLLLMMVFSSSSKKQENGEGKKIGLLELKPSSFSEAKAKEFQQATAKSIKRAGEEKEDLGKGINLEMVLIPAGKFMMGSPVGEKDRRPDEDQHEVTITKPFYMGKYEVTQEQWESVMGTNPSFIKGAKLPINEVSWYDCQEFIKKLNDKTKGGYRLPTEAEWEYAGRAAATTAYSFGDKITPKDANYYESMIGHPVAVGSYKENAFGLYDMHGNVFEWCEDWKVDYPKGSVADPKGPDSGTYRVLRAGDFRDVIGTRSALRGFSLPVSKYDTYGFRLARTIGSESVTKPLENKLEFVMPPVELKGLLEAPFSEAKAKEVQQATAKSIKRAGEEKEDLGKDINLEVVLIPAGRFMMGSPLSEIGRVGNETQHEVTIKKTFYMGKYEVTQEQWEAVMRTNPSTNKGAKFPVTNVSWKDCQEFIKKFNEKTKGGFRLPTEAEWEYAARAGTTTAYSFGDTITSKNANCDRSGNIKPVGSYKANAFGLYDMHGNVWEYCEDKFGEYPKGAVVDPKGPIDGKYRVIRGGSYDSSTGETRLAFRPNYNDSKSYTVGFRLARTP